MSFSPLTRFPARVAGMDACVKILTRGIEWSCAERHGVTQIVPTSAISSVIVCRHGLTGWKLVIIARGRTTEFGVDRAVAEQVLAVLSRHLASKHRPQERRVRPVVGIGRLREGLDAVHHQVPGGHRRVP